MVVLTFQPADQGIGDEIGDAESLSCKWFYHVLSNPDQSAILYEYHPKAFKSVYLPLTKLSTTRPTTHSRCLGSWDALSAPPECPGESSGEKSLLNRGMAIILRTKWKTVTLPTFSNSKYFKMIQTTQLGCPTGTSEASANTCSEVVLGLLPFGHSLSSNMLTQQICSKGCSKMILEVTKSSICSLDSACMPPEMKVFCPFTTSASCDQWHVAMTNLWTGVRVCTRFCCMTHQSAKSLLEAEERILHWEKARSCFSEWPDQL